MEKSVAEKAIERTCITVRFGVFFLINIMIKDWKSFTIKAKSSREKRPVKIC